MFETIEMDAPAPFGARIKVIGVGGGGGNAVNNMIAAELMHIGYVVANTDAQALERNLAPEKVQIGQTLTRGLGAGAKPEVGHKAALEDLEALQAIMADADMVFITAGMGGGTGTGAAPVIARAARDAGALTVGVVTRPFGFEGGMRARQAEAGLRELAEAVDTLIVIPNDRILQVADKKTSFKDAFKLVDSVLVEAVRGISEIIMTPGLINVDFADVVAIMKGRGMALMGTGRASGDDRARAAARMAISSPLLEDARVEGATGLLVAITGNSDLSLSDVHEAMTLIQEAAAADTNTIFGTAIDESMGDEIKVTVVATGFDREALTRTPEVQVRPFADVRDRVRTVPSSGIRNTAVPPPIPPQVEEPVHVYAAAAHSQHEMVASVHSSAPPMPRSARPHIDEPVDLDEPSYQRRTPSYGIAAPALAKREPLVTNPFTPGGVGDIDKPAFMRK